MESGRQIEQARMGEQAEGGYGGVDVEAGRKAYGHDQADQFRTHELRTTKPHNCQHIRTRPRRIAPTNRTTNGKGPPWGDPHCESGSLRLQGGFDFKAPSFEQGLGDVLGILVPARPLPQSCRAQVLVGGELILVHNLLEFGDCGSNRPNRLGLAPVWVSASFSHEKYTLSCVE